MDFATALMPTSFGPDVSRSWPRCRRLPAATTATASATASPSPPDASNQIRVPFGPGAGKSSPSGTGPSLASGLISGRATTGDAGAFLASLPGAGAGVLGAVQLFGHALGRAVRPRAAHEQAVNGRRGRAGAVPHRWLFPRASAVIHHGGAGTTAAVMRAGVPSAVVWFLGDQPTWGTRIARLGVGTAGRPRHRGRRSAAAAPLSAR